MGIELRQIAPDDPVALELAEALRDEVEATPGGGRRRKAEGTAREIKRMYVVPAYRGSGVATQIHDELERRARERGFETGGIPADPGLQLESAVEPLVREASA